MKSIKEFKSIIWYGAIFLGLIVVILIQANFFYGKITELTSAEVDLQGKVTVLQNRKNALSALSPEVVAQSYKVISVLPSENVSLLATSQIRLTAQNNGILLRNLTTSSPNDPTSPELKTTQINMILEGDKAKVLNFLKEITNLAPIMVLDSLNLSSTDIATTAQATIVTFWSTLPTQLPALTEALKELSVEETDMLKKIEGYKFADTTTTSVDNSPVTPNSNPFAPVL